MNCWMWQGLGQQGRLIDGGTPASPHLRPDPLQLPHLLNPRPLQKLHLKPLSCPVPLHWKQGKGPLPLPLQLVQTAARARPADASRANAARKRCRRLKVRCDLMGCCWWFCRSDRPKGPIHLLIRAPAGNLPRPPGKVHPGPDGPSPCSKIAESRGSRPYSAAGSSDAGSSGRRNAL